MHITYKKKSLVRKKRKKYIYRRVYININVSESKKNVTKKNERGQKIK